jgi:16S rRNA (guanine527-N7)-methyltransferase
VLDWTPRLRLAGVRTRTTAARVLVAEGLEVVPLLPEIGPVADLGSGAGIPGVLVALLRPDLHVALVEASGKKAGFLEVVVRELALLNAEVICVRAESLGRDPGHRSHYAAVTARALASLPVLVEYAAPLLRVDGIALFPKGETAGAEIQAARRALAALGASAELVAPVSGGPPTVVIVHKRAPTSDMYPRRVGVPERRPI